MVRGLGRLTLKRKLLAASSANGREREWEGNSPVSSWTSTESPLVLRGLPDSKNLVG